MFRNNHHESDIASARYITPLFILAMGLAGCGGDDDSVTVRGTITDSDGTQSFLVGGSGTVAAATTVQASAITANGSLDLEAEADVRADGSYEIVVPPERTHVVLQAVSGSGEVLASAVLEATGSAGGEVTATPMDTESSVEAEVLLAMAAQGAVSSSLNIVDLRSRIDAETAVTVRAASAGAEAEISALAEAIAAAQEAEIRAYADAGVTITQEGLLQAELAASQALSVSLHRGDQAVQAYTDFFAAVRAAADGVGADAETQSSAEASASVSFRLTVEGRLSGGSAQAQAVADAAIRAAAQLEARASVAAVEAILSAAAATSAIQDSARGAGATLITEVSAAGTAQAAAEAYANFSAALIGDASVTGSILGNHLQVDAAAEIGVNAAIDAAVVAAAEFDTAARAGVTAAIQASSIADPDVVAQAVVSAWTSYRAAVAAAVTSNQLAFGQDSDLGAALFLEATGSFRAATE